MSKYGVISGLYFPVFGLNTEKYGPEITPYLDTFYAVFTLKRVRDMIRTYSTSNITIRLNPITPGVH